MPGLEEFLAVNEPITPQGGIEDFFAVSADLQAGARARRESGIEAESTAESGSFTRETGRTLRQMGSSFVRGFADTVGSIGQGVPVLEQRLQSVPFVGAQASQLLGREQGFYNNPLNTPELTPEYQGGSEVRRYAEENFGGDPELRGEFISSDVPSAVGSSLAFAAAGPAGAPGVAGAGVLAGMGGAYDEGLQMGMSSDTAQQYATIMGATGATEAIPLKRMFDRIPGAKEGFRRITRNIIQDAGEEGLQEFFQGVVQEASKTNLTDPNATIAGSVGEALTNPDVYRGAAVGAVAGGAMGTAGNLAQARLAEAEKRAQESARNKQVADNFTPPERPAQTPQPASDLPPDVRVQEVDPVTQQPVPAESPVQTTNVDPEVVSTEKPGARAKRERKAALLTEEGARAWAGENAEAAQVIAGSETVPTRRVMGEAGLSGLFTAEERKQFQGLLKAGSVQAEVASGVVPAPVETAQPTAEVTAQPIAQAPAEVPVQVPAAAEEVRPAPVSSGPKQPWQMTREEFEATGETLLHGTSRQFDKFDPQATNRFGRKAQGRFYFTDQREVAEGFSRATGSSQVQADKFFESEDGYPEPGPERDAAREKIKQALRKQLSKKARLTYVDESTGAMIEVKDPDEIANFDENILDGDVRLWSPGSWPRVVETQVFGRTLDLSDPKKLPQDWVDYFAARGQRPPVFEHNSFSHETDARLLPAMRELGYLKAKVPDAYESGFASYVVLPEAIGLGRDAHRELVEQAIKDGKKVPADVLAQYPDLAPPAPVSVAEPVKAQPVPEKVEAERSAGEVSPAQQAQSAADAPQKNAWEMTREEWYSQKMRELAREYPSEPESEIRALAKMEERQWTEALAERARVAPLAEPVLDSLFDAYPNAIREFGGALSKGIEGYIPKGVREARTGLSGLNAPRDSSVKAAHEKTWEEYRKAQTQGATRRFSPAEYKKMKQQHRDAIINAHYAGRLIPAEVLAGYPDLELQIKAETNPAQAAQSEADARDANVQQLAGGLGLAALGGAPKIRTGTVPSSMQASDPEVERRMQAAHGVRKPGFVERLKTAAERFKAITTRAQEFLPDVEEWASANEFFRLLKVAPSATQDEAIRTVAAIVDPLSDKQLQLFERFVAVRNMLAAVDRGEPLRFGFKDRQEVQDYYDKLNALVQRTPEVQKALDTRKKVLADLVKKMVDNGLLPEEVLGSAETYFHQQVLMYQEAARQADKSTARKVKRSFQRGRVNGVDVLGEEYDFNMSYLEAETSFMSEAMHELRKKELLDDLASRYSGQKGQDGFSEWQPEPGNYFYAASTIPEKVAEDLQKQIIKTFNLKPEDVRQVTVLGGKKPSLVLPDALVEQLNALEKPRPAGPIDGVLATTQRLWKVWILTAPQRVVGYMLRNITGDLDGTFAGAPGSLGYIPRAEKEVRAYIYGEKLAMSPEMRAARDLGVIGASMTAQDVEEIGKTPALKRFTQESESLPARYFRSVTQLNEYREALSRYAAFLYYRDALTTGNLTTYGGAKPEIVEALVREKGVDVAAAHLSRNLLGDYGNLTVAGNWLRSYAFPFWAWSEINMKRYANLFKNALRAKDRKAAGRAGASLALRAGVFKAAALLQIGAFYGLISVYNQMFFPDEEEDLTNQERSNPHITMGRNADGSVRVFRNVGALGDFLEWFGINSLVSLYPQYEEGQIDGGTVLREMAKDPVNKVIGGTRPDIKTTFEVATGQSLFPDAFNPRSVPRDEAAAGLFGLGDFWKGGKGAVLQDGTIMRPHQGWRLLGVGIVDPRESALQEMYDLRTKFLRQQGKETPGFRGTSAFKNMRVATAQGDFEAFKKAKRKYEEDGKTFENFKASLRSLDPIAGRLSEEDEKKFEEFLNPLQRQKLTVVRDYSRSLETNLWINWQRAVEEEGTPEQKKQYQEDRNEVLISKARILSSQRPEKATDTQTKAERIAEWKASREEALRWLTEKKVPASEVRKAYNTWLKDRYETQDARRDHMRRLNLNLSTTRTAASAGQPQ